MVIFNNGKVADLLHIIKKFSWIFRKIIVSCWIKINKKYDSGMWPSGLMEVTMFALEKKQEATKCSNHPTVSLIEWAKIVAKIIRRRLEKNLENVLVDDKLGFSRGRGARDAIRMLRIISQWTLDTGEVLGACFLYSQKALDCVK